MEIFGRQPDDTAEKSLYDLFETKLKGIEGTAWFNLEPREINEIDCFAWFKDYGCFVIETKGFKISEFSKLSHDHIQFTSANHQSKFGYKPTPWRQAKEAAKKLGTFLWTKKNKLNWQFRTPWVFSFAYFPYISKSEFIKAFPNSKSLTSTIIFNDCHLDLNYFKNALQEAMTTSFEMSVDKDEKDRNTKIKNRVKQNLDIYRNIDEFKKLFLSALEPTKIEHYDLSLINTLEKSDFDSEIQEINFDYPVYRYGYAGSGKTIISLKILQKLARQDKVVLFSCFNKVLGTDIRRLHKLTYKEEYQYLENIVIKDIHELISDFHDDMIKVSNRNENVEEYFNSIVSKIIDEGHFARVFDFIVIDEAQDLKDYGWRLLLHLSKNGYNSMMVLDGREQNLYVEKSSIHLKKFIQYCNNTQLENKLISNSKRKNRIYRNKTRTFLFAQSFLDDYPDSTIAAQRVRKNQKQDDPSFEFVRDSGDFPNIVKISSSNNGGIYKTIKKVIEKCLLENNENGLGESSILVLVPYSYQKGNLAQNRYRDFAIKALSELKRDYIDYTIDNNRRIDYLVNQVRIAPFHSSRGIESNFTIILGFEELFHIAEITKCDYHKLGYIILSRAKFDTWVFLDITNNNEQSQKLLNYCKDLYREVAPGENFIYNYPKEEINITRG